MSKCGDGGFGGERTYSVPGTIAATKLTLVESLPSSKGDG